MFKLAIEVCSENHFGLIHALFLSRGSSKSVYIFLGHSVHSTTQFELHEELNVALYGTLNKEMRTNLVKEKNFETAE